MSNYTEETQEMLATNENKNLDYKESAGIINPSDIVAFANADGGTILIGVREVDTANGSQRGIPIGLRYDSFDTIRNAILSKSQSLLPPVAVEVFEEFDGTNKIIRVDIQESESKPCCTRAGIYKIRVDGSSVVISPDRMKSMILDGEMEEFTNRLKTAGDEITKIISDGQDSITSLIAAVAKGLDTKIASAMDPNDDRFSPDF